jgi:SulP family sulfate permease
MERAVVEHLAANPDVRHVCLFAQPINRIDATGVEVLSALRRLLQGRGIMLHVSGIKLPVERVLRKAGELEEGPLLHLYRTDTEALLAFGRVGAKPADPDADQALTIQPSSGSRSSGSP